jgi:hypothetical protein
MILLLWLISFSMAGYAVADVCDLAKVVNLICITRLTRTPALVLFAVERRVVVLEEQVIAGLALDGHIIPAVPS